MGADTRGLGDSGVRTRPRAGDLIGNYEIIGKLASGGMAELYVAKRVGLEGFQKVVVLKRILPHLAENPEFVEMFLSEARLAATLEHPNIVHVSDIGKEDGDFFFTMAYIHGKDLLAILRRSATLQQRFPLAHALTVAQGICAGLHYAHEQVDFQGRPLGIVHRDVSPANVLVTWHGNVKVVDFGIAKAATQTGVTQVGVRKGKASYMSPEQCRAKDIDRRADIWAIGVVLYEVTTMTRLFKADNELAIMHRIVTGDVPMPHTVVPDYPPQLAHIVMKCLDIDPNNRYPTAQALRRDLEAFAHDFRLPMSTDALGDYLRQLYPPQAQRLPWTTNAEMVAAASPQHVPSIADRSQLALRADANPQLALRADAILAPTRVTSSGPLQTSMTPAGPGGTDPAAMHASASLHGTSGATSQYGHMVDGTSPGHASHASYQPAASGVHVTMPVPIPAQQIASGQVPPVDPRSWESGGTTDTDGPGQVTQTGRDETGVAGRPVAAWITAAVIGVVAAGGGVAWAVWPTGDATQQVATPDDPEQEPPPAASEDRLRPDEILVLVDQRDPDLALDYERRHALLQRLGNAGPAPDHALQHRLDLVQANAAPDPCKTFATALGEIEKAASADDIRYLERATAPSDCPDLATRLDALRAKL
jgi:serine/threonine protein kinase